MASNYILRDDYQKILSIVFRNYLKSEKDFKYAEFPHRLNYLTLTWIIRLADYYRSLIDFKNPLECEACADLLFKAIYVFASVQRSRYCNIFMAFTKINQTKYDYKSRKYFIVTDTVKNILSRQPKNGASE